jgi:hypothetical protein
MVASKAHEPRADHDITADGAAHARQALLVLGMHRSGTSALTRVLGLSGAALPRHKMAPARDNTLGFWEPQPIVDAHDAFLKQAGTGWEAIADYPAEMFTSDAAAACRRSLAALVASEYGDAPLFILKDPRISRLMPLWRPVLSELGAAPRILIMVRNPLEISGSLKARSGWSEHRALLVWLRYMLAAERDTRDLKRCFVGYGQLMNDWRGTVGRLSDQLGIAFPECSRTVEQQIDGFLSPNLRHHRHRADTLFRRDDIADCVKQAYRSLSTATETGTIDQAALDRIAGALDEAGAMLEHMTLSGARPVRAFKTRPEGGDTLTALMLAEIEQANDIASQSQRLLGEMRATWSWRVTKPFRALGRTAGRLIGKQD